MAYTLPVGFSFVGATPAAGTTPAATNQYGFAAGSLNFQPASDFAAAPKVTTPATPVAPVAPTSVAMPVSAPAAAPVVTAAPAAAPKTYSLPPGFSFKTPAAPAPAPAVMPPPDRTMPIEQAPTPAPVQQPVVTPAPTPAPVQQPVVTPAPTPAPVVTPPVAKPPVTTGPVAPATPIKTPTMTTTTPKPPVVDPLTAAVKNQGYTDAQIKAAGGAQALLKQVNTKTSTGGSIANPTAAVNYTWADLNKAVGSLQKVNPNMSIQGIPLSKWSSAGVASLAKTDPAIFKALQSYLPKY